jgi:citrate lyase subunit beta/citryl-CoA lyase
MLDKALRYEADILILDLEDAVAPDRKDLARSILPTWLAHLKRARPGPVLWVRVNPGRTMAADVAAVLAAGQVAGICRPKTTTPDDVRELADILDELGSTARIAAIIEDAGAVLAAREIAAVSRRVARLQLGEADLCAATGIMPGPDETELLWARSHLVLASSAAGLEPPLGPVSTDYRDLGRLRETTERLLRLGFGGRACIHPAQLPVVRDVFTPSADQLEDARRTLEAFERGPGGAVARADGSMVDEAVASQARALIARAGPQRPAQ